MGEAEVLVEPDRVHVVVYGVEDRPLVPGVDAGDEMSNKTRREAPAAV